MTSVTDPGCHKVSMPVITSAGNSTVFLTAWVHVPTASHVYADVHIWEVLTYDFKVPAL